MHGKTVPYNFFIFIFPIVILYAQKHIHFPQNYASKSTKAYLSLQADIQCSVVEVFMQVIGPINEDGDDTLELT